MKSVQKIGLLLALIFLIPALFFSVYEISSLNKNEKIIQEIYSKQLDALLFSVNQYGDDLLNSWISKIDVPTQNQNDSKLPPRIEELFKYYSCLKATFIYDSIEEKPVRHFYSSDSSLQNILSAIDAALQQKKDTIARLVSFKTNGFQKAETIRFEGDTKIHLQCFVFISEGEPGQFRVAGLLINPESFIYNFIGPRLQTIARDQFVLSVIDQKDSTVYSTVADTTIRKSEAVTRSFWVLPNYKLGIGVKGNSIQALVNERTTTNLVLLLSLDVILLGAVVLVFRNVRKEVQLAQNKSDFVSNVSHEIRTPLALISMFAETLELDRMKSEEKKREYYHIISKESQRLSGIVNKILNFSQSEANKKILHIETLDVSAEIKNILSTYDFHLKNKGFEYSLADNPLKILADKEAFAEIIINLLDNAVKYSADRKQIEITLAQENMDGVIHIRDYGIGISKEDQKHIFDKFYRVSTGNLAKSRGTGLGLSLVKQLMQAQHGKVAVSSSLGQGALFSLRFPLSK